MKKANFGVVVFLYAISNLIIMFLTNILVILMSYSNSSLLVFLLFALQIVLSIGSVLLGVILSKKYCKNKRKPYKALYIGTMIWLIWYIISNIPSILNSWKPEEFTDIAVFLFLLAYYAFGCIYLLRTASTSKRRIDYELWLSPELPQKKEQSISAKEAAELSRQNIAYFRSTYRDDEPPKYQKEDTSPDAASSETINNIDALLESIQKE